MSTDDRIAKNEAWIEELERSRDHYERRMPSYKRGYVGLAMAGIACFAFGVMPGIWGSVCAPFVSVCGWFMLKTRLWELTSEIEALRAEVLRLREGEARAERRSTSTA